MSVVAVIPARMASSRYPGKPMALIHGVPMIGHCYFRVNMCTDVDATYVATCDQKIYDYIESIGGKAVMTSDKHERASDRAGEAMLLIEKSLDQKTEILVMVQGDEPLISTEAIAETLDHFNDPAVEIVNIMSRLRTYDQFIDKNNVPSPFSPSNNSKNMIVFQKSLQCLKCFIVFIERVKRFKAFHML